jgi:pimeloyl-[acyl-carrier protein] methyl ester esterase
MRPSYLLCHGFGFTDEYWRQLVLLLDGDVAYFDENFVAYERRYIGIGHSVGFLKLNNSSVTFDCLVGLQGFSNFCGREIEEKRTRERNIDRMIKTYEVDAVRSLKMLYGATGYEGAVPKDVKADELIADLQLMKREYECRRDCPILIIGSDDDAIVPLTVLDDNFAHVQNAQVKKINGVSHLLGFKKSAEVVTEISKFVASNRFMT